MQPSPGPNPPCEIGRTHPRDKHRMKPVVGQTGVWECPKHDMFASVVAKDVAADLERGDPFPMHDGQPGIVVRAGDERGGGVLLYYRPESA